MISIGLFKKKSKNEEPPLPDELPPMPDPQEMQSPPPLNAPTDSKGPAKNTDMLADFGTNAPDNIPVNMPVGGRVSTHDLIPNDIALNVSNNPKNSPDYTPNPRARSQKKVDEIHPSNLPDLDELPEVPSQGPDMNDTIPEKVESRELPEIPDVPEIKASSEVKPSNSEKKPKPNPEKKPKPNPDKKEVRVEEAPAPEVEDAVPEPPEIFADASFYQTPEEIKHLVEDKYETEVFQKKYNLEDQDYPQEKAVPREEVKSEVINAPSQGPIFVDIESFKTMLGDIDNIKNRIKSSDEILQHLNTIKNSKDRELEKWRVTLEDMQKKLNYIDQVVFKGD